MVRFEADGTACAPCHAGLVMMDGLVKGRWHCPCTVPCKFGHDGGLVQGQWHCSRTMPCRFGVVGTGRAPCGANSGWSGLPACSAVWVWEDEQSRQTVSSGPITCPGLPAYHAMLVRADRRCCSAQSGLLVLHALQFRADGRTGSGWMVLLAHQARRVLADVWSSLRWMALWILPNNRAVRVLADGWSGSRRMALSGLPTHRATLIWVDRRSGSGLIA